MFDFNTLYKQILTLCAMLICLNANAQNHVPNGSFEDKWRCPRGGDNLTSQCMFWYNYNLTIPDYYDSCSGTEGTPDNLWGFQRAIGGAYIGLGLYSAGYQGSEYAAINIVPLQVDSFYEVSMSVSLANRASYAIDGIGAYFLKNGPDTFKKYGLLPFVPQVDFKRYGIIYDTLNWVRLRGYVVADSAYNRLVIGNFNDTADFKKVNKYFNPTNSSSYYHIDSVVVKKTRNITLEFSDSLLCTGDTIQVGIFVHPTFFTSGNIFKVQLSDSNGSFNNPIDIGSMSGTQTDTITAVIPANLPQGSDYRIRVVATNPQYASDDNGYSIKIGSVKPARPSIANNNPVCTYDTISMSATCTTAGVNWYWYSPLHQLVSISNVMKVGMATTDDTGYYIAYACYKGCLSEPDSSSAKVIRYYTAEADFKITPGKSVKWGTDILFNATVKNGGTACGLQWFINGNPIPNATDSILKLQMGTSVFSNDSVCLRILSSYPCLHKDTVFECVSGFKNTDVIDLMYVDKYVYPNPTHDVLTLSGFTTNAKVILYNVQGATITESNSGSVRLGNLSSGIYFLGVFDGSDRYFFKVHKL